MQITDPSSAIERRVKAFVLEHDKKVGTVRFQMERENTAPCNLLENIPCYLGSTGAFNGASCNTMICALQQLNKDNLKLSHLLGHLPGMAFREAIPGNGRFEYVSDGCRSITGLTPEQLRNDSSLWQKLIHPEFREGVKNTISRAITQRHTYLAIYKIQGQEEDAFWVWEQGQAIYNDTGNPVAVEGYIACLSTIPNSQLNEILLNEQLFQIIQHSNHMFWITSAKTNQIVYASPAFDEIWGYSRDLLLQDPLIWLDAVDPKHRRNVELALAVDFNYYGQKSVSVEYLIHRPDGTTRWIRAHLSPLFDRDGNHMGKGGTATDITEEKRLADACEAANHQLTNDLQQRQQQLETLARDKSQLDKLAATGQMAAGIAHEINNPLAGIKNAVALMKTAIPADHPYQKFAGMAERELERLAGITRQMYQLYQPIREPYRSVAIQQLIEDSIALCGPEPDQKKLQFHIACNHQNTAVELPDNDVRQILINLLKNAIDASPEEATIRIESSESHNYVQISVQNQGDAISPQLKARIFEPFFTTKKGKNKGMGLGLAVCHSLATQHGGEIRVDSADGETTFTVCLRV